MEKELIRINLYFFNFTANTFEFKDILCKCVREIRFIIKKKHGEKGGNGSSLTLREILIFNWGDEPLDFFSACLGQRILIFAQGNTLELWGGPNSSAATWSCVISVFSFRCFPGALAKVHLWGDQRTDCVSVSHLSLRCGRVAAGAEVDPPLSDWCAEPAGRGADNAAPLCRRLQGSLQCLQSCLPAEEPSQSHLAANSPSRGSLPGGTVTLARHQPVLENRRDGWIHVSAHVSYFLPTPWSPVITLLWDAAPKVLNRA